MAKKHRLKINYSEITEENFDMVRELRKHDLDGNIVDDSMTILQFIKKSWLTEIKEPLTVEEAWEKYLGSEDSMDDDDETIYKSAWGDCLENQKLEKVGDEEKDNQARLDYLSSCSLLPCNREIWNEALKYARRTP